MFNFFSFLSFETLNNFVFSKLNYLFIDIAHSEELWLFPCQNCQFKAQGPKYLRQHNLTCPSNSTKDAIDENVQNIENIEKKTEEKEVINEVEIKSLNEDNVVNEQNSIGNYNKKSSKWRE